MWTIYTAWKVSKYGVFFGLNTGKYGPERTPYLDTFHVVLLWINQFIMMIGVLSDIHIKSRNWHKNGKNDIMPDTPIFF